ncbi:MAG: Pvc16 family protein, partial [Acidobacteriota bacterium]
GYGMQLLHETPVLTRNAIRTALAPPSSVSGSADIPPKLRALFTSELAEQVEQIKIIPEAPNTEEISRLWSAMGAHYRPTAAYQASVVLIESKQSAKSALPVRARNIYVVPFNQLVIEEIKSQVKAGDPILSNQPILAGQNLVIAGHGLSGDQVLVNIGGIEKTPAAADIVDTQIIVAIPPEVPAGVQGVQVIHRRLMGTPLAPHRGLESNLAAFVLRPTIVPASVSFAPDGGRPVISGSVTLTVNPPIGIQQRVVLLLNELLPLSSPPVEVKTDSYSFVAPPRFVLSPPTSPPGPIQTITIPIKGVKAATYVVRLQVDGAESMLSTDVNGQFNSPKVTIA